MGYIVTIGIPVYKASGYIEKTMEHALNQTFANIEYLVIDDRSGDGSIEVVEHLKSDHPRGGDIRILYHDRNCGVGMTRNHILDEARGKYLYFLDSDDLIEPETISLLVENSEKYQADVVYGSLDRIDRINDRPGLSSIFPDSRFMSENELAVYAFANYNSFQISVCNCLMRLDFIRANQLRFLDTVFWEDLAFTYEMVTKVKRAVLLPSVTYHYLCRPGSLSHYQDREKLEKVEIQRNVHVIDYLKEKSRTLIGKPYIPHLCKNLEMNSFYIVCHILKHAKRICPSFTSQELRAVMSHPLPLREILKFQHVLLPNVVLWLLGKLPLPFFKPAIWLLGKLRKAI